MSNTTNKREGNKTFTNSYLNSYDTVTSSLSFKYINDGAFFTIAPIHANMVGKQPKAGERVYDYENAFSFFVSPSMALSLKQAIVSFLEDQESETPTMKQMQVESNNRSITLMAPGTIRLTIKGEKRSFPDNFIIRFESITDGETTRAYHVLQHEVIKFMQNGEKEFSESLFHSDLELIKAFCDEIVKLNLGTSRHISSFVRTILNQNGGQKSKGTSAAFSQTLEEDDDIDNDDDNDVEPTQPRNQKSKPKAKPSMSKSLSDDFGDDDLE